MYYGRTNIWTDGHAEDYIPPASPVGYKNIQIEWKIVDVGTCKSAFWPPLVPYSLKTARATNTNLLKNLIERYPKKKFNQN